jgi:hypothetical protein
MSDTNTERGYDEKGPEKHYVENSKLDGHHDGVGNEQAFKGDNSDGSIDWTPKTIIAAASLGCLYAGEFARS